MSQVVYRQKFILNLMGHIVIIPANYPISPNISRKGPLSEKLIIDVSNQFSRFCTIYTFLKIIKLKYISELEHEIILGSNLIVSVTKKEEILICFFRVVMVTRPIKIGSARQLRLYAYISNW